MFVVELGQNIDPNLSSKITFNGGGTIILSKEDQMFVVGMPNLTTEEVRACQGNPIDIGLMGFGDATFILMNIGNVLELDFSYNYDVGPEEGRGLAPIPYNQGYAFSLILFDTVDQKIKALRFFTVTPSFSEELHFMIESARAKLQAGDYNFKYWFDKAMKKYKNPSHMWKDCVIKEKAGKSFKE